MVALIIKFKFLPGAVILLKIQNDEAIRQAAKFARMVVKMIEENFDIEHLRKAGSCSIVSVYDAANEIIAQE